jgi:preprotein translocase subunit SecA
MRIFGSERMDGMLQKLGLQEGEAIVHSWINKAIERAQTKVEARNFDIRKNLLKYDDVMNDQRKVIFEQRHELLEDEDLQETVREMRREIVAELVAEHIPPDAYPEQWDMEGLAEDVREILGLDLPVVEWASEEGIADEEIEQRLIAAADENAAARAARFGPEIMRQIEKAVVLQTLDQLWREHLSTLDHLRQVIGLRGYGQRDPLNEYKTEAFELFRAMLGHLREAVTEQLSRVEVISGPPPLAEEELPPMTAHHFDPASGEDELMLADVTTTLAPSRPDPANIDPNNPATWGKVSRNAPCPCGSGKKYKHCHGVVA